jgi:hypothetical protein
MMTLKVFRISYVQSKHLFSPFFFVKRLEVGNPEVLGTKIHFTDM